MAIILNGKTFQDETDVVDALNQLILSIDPSAELPKLKQFNDNKDVTFAIYLLSLVQGSGGGGGGITLPIEIADVNGLQDAFNGIFSTFIQLQQPVADRVTALENEPELNGIYSGDGNIDQDTVINADFNAGITWQDLNYFLLSITDQLGAEYLTGSDSLQDFNNVAHELKIPSIRKTKSFVEFKTEKLNYSNIVFNPKYAEASATEITMNANGLNRQVLSTTDVANGGGFSSSFGVNASIQEVSALNGTITNAVVLSSNHSAGVNINASFQVKMKVTIRITSAINGFKLNGSFRTVTSTANILRFVSGQTEYSSSSYSAFGDYVSFEGEFDFQNLDGAVKAVFFQMNNNSFNQISFKVISVEVTGVNTSIVSRLIN